MHDAAKWALTALEDDYTAIVRSDRPFFERWQRILLEKNQLRHLYNGELLPVIRFEYPVESV